MHLLGRQEHADKCTSKRCAPACGFERYEQWLHAPLLASDFAEDERFRQRSAAILRGDI